MDDLAELERRAGDGDPASLYELYQRYARGTGGAVRNVSAAMESLREAADRGSSEAQLALARETFARSRSESLSWALKAATHGLPEAMTYAGQRLLADGDVDDALRWLERGAAAGQSEAVAELARERTRQRAATRPDAENVADAIRSLGLSVEPIMAVSRPSRRLVAHRGEAPIGTSQLGGSPDLPPDVAWPCQGDQPLSFIAQVVHQGRLLVFFYDVDGQPSGYKGEEAGWRVLACPLEGLERRPAPDETTSFEPCTLTSFEEVTLPPPRSALARGLSCEQYGDIDALLWQAYRRRPIEDGHVHRLLGHPDAIQGDMTRRIAYTLAGGDMNYPDPEVEVQAAGWRLLLQVDSSPYANMMWGDLGRLYYWIRAEDLAASRFDGVWVQSQC